MSYTPLRIAAAAPNNVYHFVRNGIDPLFYDVHSMLRMPLVGIEGCEAACNFSIAMVLVNVVSGASTVFFGGPERSGRRFVTCASEYYPWEAFRLKDDVVGETAARLLYGLFRNPFAHSFGLDAALRSGSSGPRFVRTFRTEPFQTGVSRILRVQGEGLDDSYIDELDVARRQRTARHRDRARKRFAACAPKLEERRRDRRP
jgi:hypothetical protein